MLLHRTPFATALSLFAFLAVGIAQNRIGTGKADKLYKQHCATCHGQDMEGGQGSSLIDDVWAHGSTDEAIAKSIRLGYPDQGMVPWAGVLDEKQIRALTILIREKSQLAKSSDLLKRAQPKDGKYTTKHHSFHLEKVHTGNKLLWSLAFMPDDKLLATSRQGSLFLIEEGKKPHVIKGTPAVWQHGQGGLLEVALHPDFEKNGWVYLSFSENTGGKENGRDAGMTAVVRGKINKGRWVKQQEIFHVPSALHSSAGVHFGSRFVFKDGYLYFGIGDRGRQSLAQDLSRPNGKIHRIHDDGRTPADNPFSDVPGAYPSIWSYGHRNPQGLDLNPETGEIWETEHGPRGGDETNHILPGNNYGWPVITYGMNYNGSPITDKTAQDGMEQPAHYWTPSIAVCGIDFYEGDQFPSWKNNLFVGGLASQELQRLVVEDGKVTDTEIVLKNQGRVRDVATGPEGGLYVVLNQKTPTTGSIYRLVPTD